MYTINRFTSLNSEFFTHLLYFYPSDTPEVPTRSYLLIETIHTFENQSIFTVSKTDVRHEIIKSLKYKNNNKRFLCVFKLF